MVKAGNRVVFDQHEGENISHILNKESGNTIPIEEVNSQYEFDMFLPVKKGTKMQDAMVVAPEEVNNSGYTGIWSSLQVPEEKNVAEFFLGLV